MHHSFENPLNFSISSPFPCEGSPVACWVFVLRLRRPPRPRMGKIDLVHSGGSTSSCPTWSLVELQGKLNLQGDDARLQSLGFTVGTYTTTSPLAPHPEVVLEVGNHTLHGRPTSLRKPLVVLERVTNSDGLTQLQVRGVIRDKVVFASKPRAIIHPPNN
jgi:hypothetical protein